MESHNPVMFQTTNLMMVNKGNILLMEGFFDGKSKCSIPILHPPRSAPTSQPPHPRTGPSRRAPRSPRCGRPGRRRRTPRAWSRNPRRTACDSLQGHPTDLPSGKLLHNYGKSQFLRGKLTINGHFQ